MLFIWVEVVLENIGICFDSDGVILVLGDFFQIYHLEHEFYVWVALAYSVKCIDVGPMRKESWGEILLTDVFIWIQWFRAEKDVITGHIADCQELFYFCFYFTHENMVLEILWC